MRAKLIVSENWMVGCQHLGVNLGLIEIFSRVYKDLEIHYYGESSQNAMLREKLSSIRFHNVSFPKYRLWALPFFDFYTAINLLRILFSTRKNDKILITNKLVIAHILYNLGNLILKRTTFIVLHSEMEALINPTSVGKTRFYMYFHKIGFALSGNHTSYVVLGESIKMNIIKSKTLEQNKIICIDHPYDYGQEIVTPEVRIPIKMGTIGRALRIKRSDLIFELANLLHEEIQQGLLTLEIVGGIEPAIFPSTNTSVVFPHVEKMMDSEEFQRKISDLDYVLCFFDASTYMCTPSGTVFDAIKFSKPTLMIVGNTFMDYYCKKFPGTSQGFLNLDAMATYIRQLIRLNNTELKSIHIMQQKALKLAREALSSTSLAQDLKQQIDIINNAK